MKNKIVSIAIVLLMIACKEPQVSIHNDGSYALDSIRLRRSHKTIIINIGNKISPRPLCSQIYNQDDSYILLDENSLYFFSLSNGELLKAISINDCGNLNNYSGFLYLNKHIFFYNYKNKNIYLTDLNAKLIDNWNVIDQKKAKYPVDPEALTASAMIFCDNKILLSGSGLGQPDDATSENKPISCVVDTKEHTLRYGVAYPEPYRRGNFGGVYFNTIYHTFNGDNSLIYYSFPASHYIYSCSIELSESKCLYMGSRYSKTINSSKSNPLDLFKNKTQRIKYYIGEHSYSNVLYDEYRKVFYRIAQHPLNNWDEKGSFIKPFSIIVMDSNGKLITETPILTDYTQLNLHNMHVTRDGLLIQKNNNNEDIIEFILYTLD